jgi:hypothetical protein
VAKLNILFPSSHATMASDGPTSLLRPPTPRIHRHNVGGIFDVDTHQDQRFARDIEVVGPMPVNLFLETFLPYRTRIPQVEDVSFSGIPDEPDRESVTYASLVCRENPTSRGTFSHIILKETT